MNMSEERRAHGDPDNLAIVAGGDDNTRFKLFFYLKCAERFFLSPFCLSLLHRAGKEMKMEDERGALKTGVCSRRCDAAPGGIFGA